MKLNKVLALALSGIMAVSMLAGCSGKTDDNKDEQAPATGIVAAVNDGQTNDVKVTFTADATLDTQLTKAVAAAGETASESTVEGKLKTVMGVEDAIDLGTTIADNTFMVWGSTMENEKVTSKKVVGIQVVRVDGSTYSEAYAQKKVVEAVNNITEQLKKSTTPDQINQAYATYDYAGTVSMIETTTLDGASYYYAAIVITNTCTLKTVTV